MLIAYASINYPNFFGALNFRALNFAQEIEIQGPGGLMKADDRLTTAAGDGCFWWTNDRFTNNN